MGTNNLFSNNESNSNNQNELSGDDSLKLLVGDGKKYATVEDLAKGMVHSQAHITTLESEATSHKESQDKQHNIDDILAAIKAGGNNEQQQPGDNQNLADQQGKDTSQAPDISKLIKDEMASQAQTTSAAANVKLVTEALSKSLGVRANEVYKTVGESLGVDLDELSKSSPEAVIKLCTGQQAPAQQPGQTFQSRQNNQAVVVQQRADGSMTYEQIQVHAKATSMPREERFKLEMTSALAMGDSFYDKQN